MKKNILTIIIGGATLIVSSFSVFVFLNNDQAFFENVFDRFFNTTAPDVEEITNSIEVPIPEPEPVKTKPEEREVHALYSTGYSASIPSKVQYYIDTAKSTEINAVVFDIKDATGYVFYDSQLDEVNSIGAKKLLIDDIKGLIDTFHENDIYVIARQVVFQDPIAARAHPEWAVQSSGGGLWHDYRGQAWLDASNEATWEYNLAITQEVIEYGVDEVNFDYIRFPSDGPMSTMRFKNWPVEGQERKSYVMKQYFEYLYNNLKDEPVYLSVDLFGLTTERDDDMNIGQEIEHAALYFDYIGPMVYPSHYPSGYLNLSNPAAHPYDVVYNAILKGVESINSVEGNRAKIRPWIQDFHLGATYTSAMVRAQINASIDAGGYGYFVWDPKNTFTISAFK